MTPAPTRTSLLVWRVPTTRLPRTLWRMAFDRRRLRRTPGITFAKLLGTSRGGSFGPTRADPSRWAAVLTWTGTDPDDTPVVAAWGRLSTSRLRLDLTPLAARGAWSGTQPFDAAPAAAGDPTVLALTRARLRPTGAIRFWRSIGRPGAAAHRSTGLLAAFGIGEAPIGWQGTVSVWRSAGDLVEFAYRDPDHRSVIDATPARGWYAEELFARFAVTGIEGDRGLIGWRTETDA